MVTDAFPGTERRGLRENVRDWAGLRNTVAHRHLPTLDTAVIPWAQAGLLNFENAVTGEFGEVWALSDQLSVPLQLAGFRNPDIVASLRQLQATLPLDVQAILTRAAEATPELLSIPVTSCGWPSFRQSRPRGVAPTPWRISCDQTRYRTS